VIGLAADNGLNRSYDDKPLIKSFILKDNLDPILVTSVVALSKIYFTGPWSSVCQGGIDCDGSRKSSRCLRYY
jgi:hypothetical protein